MRLTSDILRQGALYGASAALGFAAAFFFAVPGTDKAPEFFGAFVAAIIAAAALVMATFYQNDLRRRRDQEARDRDRNSNAMDLCFWLNHCDYELEFISDALNRIREQLTSQDQTHLDLPIKTVRTIISPRFFEELTERAKMAAKLPPEIAGLVASDLYKTFTITDRIFSLNHAASDFRPSLKNIEDYIFLVNQRRGKLKRDAKLIESYLIDVKALPDFSKFENAD